MYTFIACCEATLLYIWLRNNCTAAITKMGTFGIAAVQVIIPIEKIDLHIKTAPFSSVHTP
jgi:hypothetical protein